jgi:hypothetical protein
MKIKFTRHLVQFPNTEFYQNLYGSFGDKMWIAKHMTPTLGIHFKYCVKNTL